MNFGKVQVREQVPYIVVLYKPGPLTQHLAVYHCFFHKCPLQRHTRKEKEKEEGTRIGEGDFDFGNISQKIFR
ncbi:hypothetical protein AAC387_Pa06g2329 [Persea americana]